MGIEYFLFSIFLLLSFWLIPKIKFIQHADLTGLQVRLLLGFKMLAGIACAFYFERLSNSSDYTSYNAEGTIQYRLLLAAPARFFTDFTDDINSYGLGGLFATKSSFWAYARFNLLYKFIAILDFISHGNFYFNTVIFSSLVFFGHIAFYRIYCEIYKGHKIIILFTCFCLPSLLLYTACVHKDGMIYVSLGLASFIFYNALTSPGSINFKTTTIFFLCTAAIFLFRNYVIVAIVPAMLIALLCRWLPYRKRYIFLVTNFIFFLLFFLSGLSSSSLNLPAAVVQRKADFEALGEANTNIAMNELVPTIQSFILNLPQAINHYFLRPYLWEFPQQAVLLSAFELLFYQLVVVAFIFYRKKMSLQVHPFNIFGLAFFFNMMLIIGYTIPNIGAIVRYRSIFWIYLIVPVICNIDWNKLNPFKKPIPFNTIS